MTPNDFKWIQITSVDLLDTWDSFGVISEHLNLFKSWGDNISYTINMQRSLSFCCGVSDAVSCCVKMDFTPMWVGLPAPLASCPFSPKSIKIEIEEKKTSTL
jgi:hypothetical protein